MGSTDIEMKADRPFSARLTRLDEKAERAARWSVVIDSKPYENISEE